MAHFLQPINKKSMTEASELTKSIQTLGDSIRDLKKNNGSKEDVLKKVDELKLLKAEYLKVTGTPYAPPASKPKAKASPPAAAAASGEPGKKSKNQLKKEKKLAEAQAKKAAGGGKRKKQTSTSSTSSKPLVTARPADTLVSDSERLLSACKFEHASQKSKGSGNEQVVTPWDVEAEGGVDYVKLISQFGCSAIDDAMVARFEKVTGVRAHRYLRRGFFFSHRDLDEILTAVEKGEKFYLYTGRGPSSGSLHMGHLIPFTFTAWLQKVFNAPLVIQLTNDEKFLFKNQSLEESNAMMWENAKDIIACGFDVSKTFIFADTEYISAMYPNILKVQKCVTYNQVRGIFGFSGTDNIGKSAFPAVQAVPAFSSTFPVPLKNISKMRCLIPQAIDQDPYFRMTRDVAPRIGCLKPALIHSKFFPALQGASTKMSASSVTATIFVTDTPTEIATKVKKYAFSGGGDTKADHEKYGANLEVDIPFQYLTFMMEDDEELARIGTEYGAGRMMSGEVKERLIEIMSEFNTSFQSRRAEISDDQVKEFMKVRELDF